MLIARNVIEKELSARMLEFGLTVEFQTNYILQWVSWLILTESSRKETWLPLALILEKLETK